MGKAGRGHGAGGEQTPSPGFSEGDTERRSEHRAGKATGAHQTATLVVSLTRCGGRRGQDSSVTANQGTPAVGGAPAWKPPLAELLPGSVSTLGPVLEAGVGSTPGHGRGGQAGGGQLGQARTWGGRFGQAHSCRSPGEGGGWRGQEDAGKQRLPGAGSRRGFRPEPVRASQCPGPSSMPGMSLCSPTISP